MIIDDIITVLTLLGYPITQARIDPYTFWQDNLPAIDVRYVSEKFESIGHAPDYVQLTNIGITIAVGDTNGYFTNLKPIVELAVNTLFTNAAWFSEFRRVPNFEINYEYSDGGETNYAVGHINITCETTISYQPIIINTLSTTYLNLDDISPYDPNLASIGPDGRIEIIAPITLPQ